MYNLHIQEYMHKIEIFWWGFYLNTSDNYL